MSDEHQRGVKIYWLGAYATAVRCKDADDDFRKAYEELHRQRERFAMNQMIIYYASCFISAFVPIAVALLLICVLR
jgi:hypothetical protein